MAGSLFVKKWVRKRINMHKKGQNGNEKERKRIKKNRVVTKRNKIAQKRTIPLRQIAQDLLTDDIADDVCRIDEVDNLYHIGVFCLIGQKLCKLIGLSGKPFLVEGKTLVRWENRDIKNIGFDEVLEKVSPER